MILTTTDTKINYENLKNTYKNIDFKKSLFFDIETTGFAAKNTKLYMIGALYVCNETNTFHVTQWFLDNYDDELNILKSFYNFAKNYSTLIHFNGNGFDVPYLEAKGAILDFSLNFNIFNHIDLYKISLKLKNFLKTENLKLKTLEQFLGLERKDEFSGKELISVYDEYIKTKDNRLKDFLFLHNYEDLKGMLTVINILSYSNILQQGFSYNYSTTDLDAHEVILEFTLHIPIPKRISFSYDEIYITAFDTKLKLKLPLYIGQLKFFYENYKDYYYLPAEDMAVHKSVATYVDKEYKTKAKASNCYTRKNGAFLKQYSNIINPYFKMEYNDKTTYFQWNEDIEVNSTLIDEYAAHILTYLSNIK